MWLKHLRRKKPVAEKHVGEKCGICITHAHTHTHTYIYTHTHTHTHTYIYIYKYKSMPVQSQWMKEEKHAKIVCMKNIWLNSSGMKSIWLKFVGKMPWVKFLWVTCFWVKSKLGKT